MSQWPDLCVPLPEDDPLQDIAENEPFQKDCSSNDQSKNKSVLKSQTSLDDDYFDFDRHPDSDSDFGDDFGVSDESDDDAFSDLSGV